MEAKHRLFKDHLRNTLPINYFTMKLSYFQHIILGFGEAVVNS